MNKKILLVGPLLPPVHGQSLAFTRFYESIASDEKLLVDTNIVDKRRFCKALLTFKTVFLMFYKIFFNKPDVVYFTSTRSFMGSIKDVWLIRLASFKNIKLVNHLHGSDFYDFFHSCPQWYQRILFNAYEKIDTSIVLLPSMKEQFKDFKSMKIEVVPNFYDRELDLESEPKDKSGIHLLYLSNIIKSKGIFELIDAFEALSKKYENIYLNIAGNFMGDEYLSGAEVKKRFLEQTERSAKINYLGIVEGKTKVKLLQRSDIFVLPSYYKSEAFPISIVEAMRCANAIITTNYKYLPEIIDSKNGVLVEPGSLESLIDGIDTLLADHERLTGIQEYNKRQAKEKYSVDKYIAKLNTIILENP